MNFNVIFLAGVHGVGKGYLVNSLKDKVFIWSQSASAIIKAEKLKEVDNGKLVLDADENQDYLVKGLNKLDVVHETLILDGHFCLQSSTGIYDVPVSTFESINISTIFLLTDDIDVIHKRLFARDGDALDKEMIFNLQEAEKSRAVYIANQFNLPVITGTSSDTLKFLNVLMK